MAIFGNMIGGVAPLKTVLLVDENGNEILGVAVDKEVIFTATDNDVKKGLVYAGDKGVSIGTRYIPLYNYAIISKTGLCNDVYGTSKECKNVEGYIYISEYNPDYIGKYYNAGNGKWYLEESFTTEWTPA